MVVPCPSRVWMSGFLSKSRSHDGLVPAFSVCADEGGMFYDVPEIMIQQVGAVSFKGLLAHILRFGGHRPPWHPPKTPSGDVGQEP